MRSMTSHARALARFAVRYCGTATVGIFASEWLGLPLLLTAWCVGMKHITRVFGVNG